MFLTKFMKAGVVDEDNKQVISEIELVEQSCSEFKLHCIEVDGQWGIRLCIDDHVMLVNPLELVSSLYDDNWYFMNILVDNHWSSCEVTIRKTQYSYEWTILNTELSFYKIVYFKYSDYIERIIQSIDTLRQAYKDGHSTAYKDSDSVTPEAIEICHRQLGVVALHPSHHKLMTNNVCQEDFVFNILNDHEEHFEIGIGKRSYKTWMSRWDFNMETFRHNFETLILSRESTIAIPFDTSNTTFQVRFVNVLDKIKNVGTGVGFEYKEYALVEILPNEFVNMPIITGYCDRKQFVCALYEGLLSLALQYPVEPDYDNDKTRSDAYNMLKSPLIEWFCSDASHFIGSTKRLGLQSHSLAAYREYDRPQSRDARVKDVILINADYYTFAQSLLLDSADYTIEDDGTLDEDLYDNDGNPIVMPELYEWQKEIEPIVIAFECGEPYGKDWADYHRRGLEIAYKLRKVLSADFDLWYKAPFEDKSGTIPHKVLIL